MKQIIQKPIAHRGLHNIEKGVIENSSSAFEAAIKADFAIECDLQLTKDNKLVVFHDETLERVTNEKGKICELNQEKIINITLKNSSNGDKIQTFRQFLDQVSNRQAIALELKPQTGGRNKEFAKIVVKELEDYKGPIAIISFVPEILIAVKKCGFKGPTGIIVERFIHEKAQELLSRKQRFILRHLLHYPKTRFDFVDADHNALDLPAVKLFRALGFPIAAWTIKSQVEADEALKWCDQIAFEGFTPKKKSQNEEK